MMRAAAALLPIAIIATTPARADTPKTVVVEQTYLKAMPGARADLIRFIEQNWFAADKIAVQRGLFTGFALYEASEADAKDWDVMVVVGYPTALGYDQPGTADAFNAIRSRQDVQRVDGKALNDLGSIVGSRRLRLAASSTDFGS